MIHSAENDEQKYSTEKVTVKKDLKRSSRDLEDLEEEVQILNENKDKDNTVDYTKKRKKYLRAKEDIEEDIELYNGRLEAIEEKLKYASVSITNLKTQKKLLEDACWLQSSENQNE